MKITENRNDGKLEFIYKPKSVSYSGNELIIIPAEPAFEPAVDKQRAALEYLATEFPENEIRSILTANIEFVSSGENFQSVACNLCGRTFGTEDWQEAMDFAYQSAFKDLDFITPCCHKKTSLNDLEYHWESGFSRYSISVYDPQVKVGPKSVLVGKLKNLLGQDLKLIWAHH